MRTRTPVADRTSTRRSRRAIYRGSGTLAMCGQGPHPGGPMFRTLCRLADRYRACSDDPEAARIGSVLSMLAVYATQPNDRDFRYDLGSTLMDLALDAEAAAGESGAVGGAEPSRGERAVARVVPYPRAGAIY